ncbi:MAG: DNA polymerase III subunit alpha [Bacteroidetes bacterium GWE2_41_25]|nr:MAG: DNA polymerase III subunit alpha [Bacteroidetes bacterium GWA2_40_15]OFX91983.1 MAG: DNA polymerase III subunit alpha [Bacteroidetes bacterium GWC2_40_22]OFY13298.1 MAG: DNA polymerase III subunit alpha [Bacteroidetes bacterium GWE2_41_25]OFY58902.1 MAG: DNA polymerase III subunit alpha [Bacteroidetes bacterium GWF2_41_9]HAM09946.1 DNA polymerase III subunit alpha [Bacteroidales bacterium]
MYINCHTYYSLRYGTMSVEQLVQKGLAASADTLVLTDINNSTAIPDFAGECIKNKIKPVAGIEFRNDNDLQYIGIARNNKGLRELNEFLSKLNSEKEPVPFPAPQFSDSYIIYSLQKKPDRKLFDNERIGIRKSEMNRLITLPSSTDRNMMVLLQPVTFADSEDIFIHKSLRAVDNNILLSHLKPWQCAGEDEFFLTPETTDRTLIQYEWLIKGTNKLLDDCYLQFDREGLKNKKIYSASRYDDKLLLEKLAWDGMIYRYGRENKEAKKRVQHELAIIDKLGFSAYFLITWDIVRYSMARGFYHVGRGSGANSVVAYCLKITNVDPIDLNLYFERFINPKRSSPPDFDIDYSWKERDEVIDYIFKRYGYSHTALLGTINTFRGKSIVRELGKVHGLPKEEIDSLIDNPASEANRNDITETIFSTGLKIADFPNMRSIHAGGILISEEPITCYTALDMPPKGFPTTQWDMYTAEEIGFEKLDILSQRGIGHIKESAEIILRNRSVDVDVHAVQKFKNDEKVKEYLRKGETKGCFYIESPAMRGLLTKLRCDNYTTLVAASSVIRPGVARSGMMKEYIYRFHNPHNFKYIHPVMKEQLEETFGVMVYQEDVLKVCHHFAGLDLADADTLRRAMSGKHSSKQEMQRIVERFFSNCRKKGYSEEVTKEVWRQIESFAGYSFSKAHSASYAVESFQSLYLKAHFPLEFMVAVINNFGGFYRTWVYVHEARRFGATIQLPCVNMSNYKTTIYGTDIYIGFIHIMSLEYNLAMSIETIRNVNGPFRDLNDFVTRVTPGLEQVILLIKAGAFRFTGKKKPVLLWEAHMMINKNKHERTRPLFSPPVRNFTLPELVRNNIEDVYDEIELFGFPVTVSWFDMLETSFRGEIPAHRMNEFTGKTVRMVGHLVTVKYIKTVKNDWMNFGCFIDAEGSFFDTVHFSQSLTSWPFKGSGTYLLLGIIVQESGFASLEVEKMAKLPVKPDQRY